MDTYLATAQATSRLITLHYSTSFGTASRLFARRYRQHIYNVYGLVRIADEIVDTYVGNDTKQMLQELETETMRSMQRGHSVNPVVQAFTITAQEYGIDQSLISPFFQSMRLDIDNAYQTKDYQTYIYGSAEVVGLMCLRIFCENDNSRIRGLSPGARALGAAFQKVNFLRDLADDYHRLGRYYFPFGSFETFDETIKLKIIEDISSDFATAKVATTKLPSGSKLPVKIATAYYQVLLKKLQSASVETIKTRRIRITNMHKLWIATRVSAKSVIWKRQI
jgi:phytoene synthase